MADDTGKLRGLDLFSGIGGISLALQRWCETVCYVEIDPYSCGVLTKNMAEGYLDAAPIWSDVQTFGEPELARVGPVDIICGGFPCQDLSVAGKREGINGKRSGLFFEIIRLVRLARPRYIFLENVPGLLVGGMDTVLGELAEAGYDAEWTVLGADDIGANHRRKRVWILAHANGQGELQPTAGGNQPGDGIGNSGPDVADSQGSKLSGPVNSWDRRDGASDGGPDVADTQRQRQLKCEHEGQPRCGAGLPAGDGPDVADTSGVHVEGDGATWEQVATVRRQDQEAKGGLSYICGRGHWAIEPAVGRVAHGVQFRVDRLRCLGNSVVPQCARTAFCELMGRLYG